MTDKVRTGVFALAALAALAALQGCAATGSTRAAPAAPAATAPPAVAMLLSEAQQASAAGEHDRAGALVERAMRLDPRNPDLYLSLARVRMNQGQPARAEGLARRAMALAPQDPRIDRGARELVAAARERAGDPTGAAAARAGEGLAP